MHLPFQMGYMTVEEHSEDLLHLKRSPGIRSWSVLVGKIIHRYLTKHPLSPPYILFLAALPPQ